MKTLKITITGLFITLCSCSKMDTNTGSGKVRLLKEFNNWIVDKTTSEPTLDEKIELQLDSITSQVKKLSLYPDELQMEVIKTTDIDLNKVVDEYVTGTKTVKSKNSISGSAIVFTHLNEETKIKLLNKFKTDNISFKVIALRFKNRISDNQLQFEYLNVLFDQNGDYILLADHTSTNDISSNLEERASYTIDEYIKSSIEELNSTPIVEQSEAGNEIIYYTREEFDNFPPSGQKDFMEHNLEWIEKTRKEETEKIKKDTYLNSAEKAEYLKEIEADYANRIADVKNDFEARFR